MSQTAAGWHMAGTQGEVHSPTTSRWYVWLMDRVVLHHAGIISFVRRDHTFHNKAPMLVFVPAKRKGGYWTKFSTEYQVLCFCDLKEVGETRKVRRTTWILGFLTIGLRLGDKGKPWLASQWTSGKPAWTCSDSREGMEEVVMSMRNWRFFLRSCQVARECNTNPSVRVPGQVSLRLVIRWEPLDFMAPRNHTEPVLGMWTRAGYQGRLAKGHSGDVTGKPGRTWWLTQYFPENSFQPQQV